MDILLISSHRYVCECLPGSNLGINILCRVLSACGWNAGEFQGYAAEAKIKIDDAMASDSPPKIVGFYVDYNNMHWVRALGAYIKRHWPSVHLIAGGPQAIDFDASYFADSGIKAACIGESEETLPELMDFLIFGHGSLEQINGLLYPKSDGTVARTPNRTPPQSLDDIPWPDISKTNDYSKYPLLPLLTGRGCPFGCAFCHVGGNEKKVRCHSVPSVLGEIERNLKQNPKIRYINLLDDTFTLDKNRVLDICAGMEKLRSEHDFIWFASAHIQTMHKFPELAPAMAKAGLKKLFFGIESGDDDTLKRYNKNSSRQMIMDTIRHCVDSGVHNIAGNIILGGPYENEETVAASSDMVDDLLHMLPGHFETAFFYFLPYPNTPITMNPERYGMRILRDMEDCCMEDIPLTETSAFNFDDMLRVRVEENRRLQSTMREIYKNGGIPDSTVLESYRLKMYYGVYTRWNPYAYALFPIEHEYWTMLAGGQYVTSGDLPDGGADHCPVRTFEIWLYTDYSEVQPSIFSVIPTELEFTLLILCSGRVSKRQVIMQAYERTNEADDSRFSALAIDAMRVLEERKWIVYNRRKAV